MNKQETLEIPKYWKCGSMLYNRDCLSPNHPEQTYNYVKTHLGIIPEDYGIYHPYYLKYKDFNKEQLMSKLGELEQKNEELEKRIIDMGNYF